MKSKKLREICKETNSRQTCLQDIIEGKDKSRPNTLIRIVHRLKGEAVRNEFIRKFKDKSQAFKTAYLVLDLEDEFESKSKISPPQKGDLLDGATHEVLMMTGCDNGISMERLSKLLPHRANLVELLIQRGILTEKDGRLFSKQDSYDIDFIYELFKTKLRVLTDISRDEARLSNVFGAEDSFDLEGVIELYKALDTFVEAYNKIKKKHSKEDGFIITYNGFISSVGLKLEEKSAIIKEIDQSLEVN